MLTPGPPVLYSASEAHALHVAHGDVKRGHLVVLSAVLIVPPTILVFARLYARFAITRNPGVDDGFLLTALLCLVGVLVTYITEDHWGSGYHASTLTLNEIMHFFHSFWATLWCYCSCLACVKMSLLAQYYRVFPDPRFRTIVKILVAFVGLASIWTVLSGLFICWPVSFFWTHTGHGKCLETWPLFISNAALGITTDLIVLGSPLPLLNSLHLPRRQKYALHAVFLLGFFVVIVSAMRLAVFVKSNGATDFSWEQMELGGWSFAECTAAIMCASVPGLKPLMGRIFPQSVGIAKAKPSGLTSYKARYEARSRQPDGDPSYDGLTLSDVGCLISQVEKTDGSRVRTSISLP